MEKWGRLLFFVDKGRFLGILNRMKPYSINPSKAVEVKYARKSKKIFTRTLIERAHKKRARRAANKEILSHAS